MTLDIVYKLLAIFATIGVGWLAIRLRWVDAAAADVDPSRILGQVSMMIFVPALLFRTMSRIDLSHMPWTAAQAYFLPAVAWALAVYLWLRRQPHAGLPAAPASRSVGAVYGNGV